MKRTFKLASVLLKCSPGSRVAEKEKMLFLGICMIPIMYYLFRAGMFVQSIFGALDGDGIVLQVLLFAVSIVLLVTGVASCINSFYLSSNLEHLLVMPYSAAQITGAKVLVAASYEYYISVLILLPILAGYGFSGGMSFWYWVGAILAVLFFPIVPLSYSAIFAMLAMRFIGAARNRGLLKVLGAVVVFVFFILSQVVQNTVTETKTDDLEQIVAALIKKLEQATMIFPNISFYVRGMLEKNGLMLLIGTGIIAVVFLLFLIAAKFLYFAGALRMQDGGVSNKKMTAKELAGEIKHVNVTKSYMQKELRTIRRMPAAYMGCILATFGWPLLIILPMMFSKSGMRDIRNILGQLVSGESQLYTVFLLFCLIFAITMIVAGTNAMAVTSISREGESFLIMKQLPIPYRTQLCAKRRAAYTLCFLGSGGYLLIAEIVLAALYGFPWWGIPVSLIFNIATLSICVDFQMIWGLLHPHLVWESEADMFSKSRIGMVMMIVALVSGCVILVFGGSWASSSSVNPWVFAGVVAAILLVIAVILNRVMYQYGERRLENL